MGAGLRRPLVLTGPPAVGKSSTGEAPARRRPRASLVDVDDVRRRVVAGGEAPWRGAEGAAQALLGVVDACALARNLRDAGFDVVLADVLTPATASAVREHLPGALLVHLVVDLREARTRAATRPVWLTDEELSALHARDLASPPEVDVTLDVTSLDAAEQVAAVEALWAAPA